MDLTEELKNYCNINNPAGALMLSGEWGCGKTYFINTQFIPSVKDTYVVVRVSLFGIDSLEAFRAEIKKKWLEQASEVGLLKGTKVLKAIDLYKKSHGVIKNILPEKWDEKVKVVYSFVDLLNFLPMSNRIVEKKTILIFDDLERSNILSTDLLGCINDYCENQHFNTIIVANEDKIKDELSYSEIKEKIVQRVIQFVPDYGKIISDIIESTLWGAEYKGLLRKNKELLIKILSGDFNDNAIIEKYKSENYKLGTYKERDEYQKEEDDLRNLLAQRPHNIRSFRCAIQDFERVYNKLVKAGIQDSSNWLLAFTCFIMVNKAGLIHKSPKYGDLFLYLNVEKLYPEVFDKKFILSGCSKWIMYGEWNDEVISKEIQLFLKKEKAVTPLQILRTHKLPEVDDEVIAEGVKDLLEEVYAGNLLLDEYVLFIYNSYYSRIYDVNLLTIDWEKVKEGIRIQIKKLIKSDKKDSHSRSMIREENKKYFTEAEWSAYQIIKEFRDNDVWTCEKNQKQYIALISSDLNSAFRELNNMRYNIFSFEMEVATINAFKNADNMDKNHFSSWFIGIWGQYSNLPGIDVQATTMSLKKLRNDLNLILKEYKEKSKNIAAGHTRDFIEKLDIILKSESENTLGNCL